MMKNEVAPRDAIARLLLHDRLLSSPEQLASYRPESLLEPDAAVPLLAVRPQSTAEIQDLVRLARSRGLALVPFASAPPHLKGGTVCSRDYIAVDLSAWKEIDLIDRRHRVCRIEPGVTYGELLAALEPFRLTVSMPLAPRSGKSVLAAVLDREPTTWPHRQWDISDPLACAEIIFGTGELFRTGAAAGPGTIEQQRAAGGAQKSPMGPSQTDFQRLVQGSQGTLGIATWITIRTELRPSREEPRLLGADDLNRLIPFVYAVQRPWLGEHCFILNRTALARLYTAAGPGDYLNVRASLPRFICLQNIAGFDRLPAERVAYQLKDIEVLAARFGLTLARSLGLVSAERLLSLACAPSPGRGWRGGAGSYVSVFFLTTLDRAPSFISLMEKLVERMGFAPEDLGIYIQPVVQNHACHVEFILADNSVRSEEVERLRLWEAVAVRELLAAGAFFSRPYGTAARAVFECNPTNVAVLRKIKKVFDPDRVLCPGKFGI